ncbi:fungal-specific transcription factor domain-containing protein [Chytriomyces sp. MP71]|nr:fungal-specific transcription factor domain-containing protein [Chytriomyces sp. MP71]
MASFGHSQSQLHVSMGSSLGHPPTQSQPPPLQQQPTNQQQQQQHIQQRDVNKKKRVPACDSCNAKKIKCDGLKPMCSMCAKNKRVCRFDRIAEPKSSKRVRTVAGPPPSAPSTAAGPITLRNGNLIPSASNKPQQLAPSGTDISANFGMPPHIPPRLGSASTTSGIIDPLTTSLPLRTTPTSRYLPHQQQAQMQRNPQFNFNTMSTSSLQHHPSSQPIAPYGMLAMNQIPQQYNANSQYPPTQLHRQQLYKQHPRPNQQKQLSQHQTSTQLLQRQPAHAIQQKSYTPTQPNTMNMRPVPNSVLNAVVSRTSSGGIHGAPQYTGPPQMRLPQHSWIRPTPSLSNLATDSSRTKSSLALHATSTAAVATSQPTTLAPRPDLIASLPKKATDDLLHLYFDYVHPTIPLLHPRSFMAAREGESKLLLHTMYALAARYCEHPAVLALGAMYGGVGAGGAGAATTLDDVRARARDMVDQYLDFARVSTVTAFLLLNCFCSGSGRISASWMYSGMAVSMIKELQRDGMADDDTVRCTRDFVKNGSNNENDWLERERRRRIWWACYVGDRYAAAASDRPTIVMDAGLCFAVQP